jgi:acyl carrier protein
MKNEQIISILHEIFQDVLDEENVVLTDETTANDIEGWDSLTHIQLVVSIEKRLKIKFTSKEILSWKNVAAMVLSIQSKI